MEVVGPRWAVVPVAVVQLHMVVVKVLAALVAAVEPAEAPSLPQRPGEPHLTRMATGFFRTAA